MKNYSVKKRSLLLALTSSFVWWSFVFVVIFFLITLVDLVYPLISGQKIGGTVLYRIIFSATASAIANFFVHFLIAPRLNKQYSSFRKTLLNIAEYGYSEKIIASMEEQLKVCMNDKTKNITYINQYAMFLGEAYLSLHQYDKAAEKLGLADYELMKQQACDSDDAAAKHNIVMLHVLWVQLYSACGSVKMTEQWITKGEGYFSNYRGINEMSDYFVDTAYFESLMIHGQYDNALKLLEKYENEEQLKFGITFDKARCLKKMGDKKQADILFDKAYKMATNDWRRKTVEIEKASIAS